MKKTAVFCCIFCLLAGILLGGILHMPWDKDPLPPAVLTSVPISSSSDNSSSGLSESLDPHSNFPLLNTACCVIRALRENDYSCLAAMVHPERGVTFTPYSTVNFETDLTFSPSQIRNLEENTTVYTWGADSRGELIRMPLLQYLQTHVFDADYTQAPKIAIDQIVLAGNALENLREAYPGCRFVDFCFPGQDQATPGMDWSSLKLVFSSGETNWLLVGVVHSEWTV